MRIGFIQLRSLVFQLFEYIGIEFGLQNGPLWNTIELLQNKFDPNWSEEEKEAYYKRKQKTTFKVKLQLKLYRKH